MVNAQHRAPSGEYDNESPKGMMGFLEHLDELRTRLIRACVAVAGGMLVAFVFVDRIADFVLAPDAILISFIVAAALTPSLDPWNQIVFAAPMIALYIISIGIAWIVAPKPQPAPPSPTASRNLRLVFAATIIDQARRRREI